MIFCAFAVFPACKSPGGPATVKDDLAKRAVWDQLLGVLGPSCLLRWCCEQLLGRAPWILLFGSEWRTKVDPIRWKLANHVAIHQHVLPSLISLTLKRAT